jgi:threonine dehydrogenase-like Zn-dependent dehydrogenase
MLVSRHILLMKCDFQQGILLCDLAIYSWLTAIEIPPCKVLVIGAGVAGLSAIATVRTGLYKAFFVIDERFPLSRLAALGRL